MVNLLAANMPLIIDIVGIVFLLIFAIRGMREGFGQMFFTTFGTIICLVLSVLLCSVVANALESWFGLATMVSAKLESPLANVFGEGVMSKTLGDLLVDGKLSAEKLQELNVSGFLQKIILTVSENGSIANSETLGDLICSAFAYYLVLICTAVALFILFKILLKIISATTEKLRSFVLVATLDELLGFAFGLISGIVYLELIIVALGGIPIPAVREVYDAIQTTKVISVISNFGLVQRIFEFISTSGIKSFISK